MSKGQWKKGHISMAINDQKFSNFWGGGKEREKEKDRAGNTNCGGRISTVDLLIKVACIVKKINNIFSIKSS
jgi:hypothetical protein